MRHLLFLGLAATAACGDVSGLGRAQVSNRVDTLELFALTGTPPQTPSAYTLDFAQVVRTSETPNFDFAFDIDTLGRAVLLPTAALHLGRASGFQQVSATPFDSIKLAPDRGYNLDSALVVAPGVVALVQSRPTTACFGLVVSYYAKLEVFAVDTAARRLDFRILTDSNCGFRGLEPGYPTR